MEEKYSGCTLSHARFRNRLRNYLVPKIVILDIEATQAKY
jgi:hypothetical protein